MTIVKEMKTKTELAIVTRVNRNDRTLNEADENYNNIVIDKNYGYHDRSRAPFHALENNLDVSNSMMNNKVSNYNTKVTPMAKLHKSFKITTKKENHNPHKMNNKINPNNTSFNSWINGNSLNRASFHKIHPKNYLCEIEVNQNDRSQGKISSKCD